MEARIVVAGKPVTGTPARATLPKSDAPVTVSVNAEGYRPAKLSLPADRDRALMVPLAKVAPPPSAAPTTSERPKHGGPKPKSSDSLVTDYPF